MLIVSCRDPGFVQTPRSDSPVTEVKTRHCKQIESVASQVGLITNTKPIQTDASMLTTNPPQQSAREVHEDLEAHRDDDFAASLAGGNPLPSEVDSSQNDDDNKPESDPNPTSPISLPPPSEAKALNFETRFCVICLMEQPLRVRHCRTCNKCVALYDHHCPWLGVCIAERNRRWFYWYLVAESGLLWLSTVQGILFMRSSDGFLSWVYHNGALVGLSLVSGLFAVLVTALLSFHTYLASANITTWECISWTKIPYLKIWPRRYGSPFSRGMLRNLWRYCCLPLPKGRLEWVYPQTLPTTSPRTCLYL